MLAVASMEKSKYLPHPVSVTPLPQPLPPSSTGSLQAAGEQAGRLCNRLVSLQPATGCTRIKNC